MIAGLFESLSAALQSTPAAALAASFVWGLLSILLSPCHLSSIPLIVGFVNDRKSGSAGSAFLLSLFFSAGHCSVILLAGTFTGALHKYLDWNEKTRTAVIVKKICGALVLAGAIYLVLS